MAYQNGPKKFERWLASQGREQAPVSRVIDVTGIRRDREAPTQPPPPRRVFVAGLRLEATRLEQARDLIERSLASIRETIANEESKS